MSRSLPALATLLVALAAAPVAAKGREVVLGRGDTLWGLARAHGCSVEAVKAANDLQDGDALRVGKTLVIPRCGAAATGKAAHLPSVLDAGAGAAAPKLDATREPEPEPEPEPEAKPEVERRIHVVAKGDTLSRIAKRHGITAAELRARNRLGEGHIHVGQTLVVAEVVRAPKLRAVPGQSIGRPDRGKLKGGIQLPKDPGYYRRRPSRAFGATHVVDHVRWAVAEVRRKFPGVHRLAVGDISDENGGALQGHRSHQSGRDVDLGLYFQRQPSKYPKEFVGADDGRLHLGATWALVWAFWRASKLPGGPQMIFLDYEVQGRLYEHARKQGVAKKVLHDLLQWPDGRHARHGIVRHEPGHADHLHVRFACAPSDRGCR
jgi:LysM repeat protein